MILNRKRRYTQLNLDYTFQQRYKVVMEVDSNNVCNKSFCMAKITKNYEIEKKNLDFIGDFSSNYQEDVDNDTYYIDQNCQQQNFSNMYETNLKSQYYEIVGHSQMLSFTEMENQRYYSKNNLLKSTQIHEDVQKQEDEYSPFYEIQDHDEES